MKRYVLIIGIFVALIAALITLSIALQRTVQMEMAEQFNNQQLLLANAETKNIKDYLNNAQEELYHIAQFASLLRDRKELNYKLLTEVLFSDVASVKKRIEFLDTRQRIVYTRGNVHAVGLDEKSVVESAKRLCPGNGRMQQDGGLVSIIMPICRYDSLIGAIVITMDIQDIARTFLSSIKSGTRGYAWMMDDKGDLLYHPVQPTMVGRNLYKTDASCFTCHKSFDVEQKIISGRGDFCSGEQYGRYVSPTGEDKILAFSVVPVGDAYWVVAVSAPYSEVTSSIKQSMRFYGWIILLILLAASGISTWLIVLTRKREQAEEREKHEKELEMTHCEKLASLERLTSGITNEIGNPLTSVFSFVQVLMDMEEDEFKKETLETISFHMNKIEDILMQLSSFSKMQPVELKPCKVNGLIEDSLSLIQYDKRVQDITVVRDLSPNLPTITSDGNQLSQVIVNIVLNAADAMPNGGTLTIRSRLLGERVEIEFQDTGVGIDQKDLARIFDPFYSTKENMAGLGLAVCSSIVKKLNGTITAESELNKGSRFVVSLPLHGA
jgi:signal transduction histidine kinase